MDSVEATLGFAGSALAGGAAGLRIEGSDRVCAVRSKFGVPIIGLIKRDLLDSPVRITPYLHDVEALAQAGSDIIAVDVTDRVRPVSVSNLIAHIHSFGLLAMADCSTFTEAKVALEAGADILGSTMSGYTGGTIPREPDIELVKALRSLNAFVIAEGRINTPELAGRAAMAGADAVVVGSAITRPDVVTSWFVNTTKAAYE